MWNRLDRLDELVDVEAGICEEMIKTGYGYINSRLVVNRRLVEQRQDSLSDGSTLGAGVLGLGLRRHARGCRWTGMER